MALALAYWPLALTPLALLTSLFTVRRNSNDPQLKKSITFRIITSQSSSRQDKSINAQEQSEV